jgi:hypothetical protein
MSASLRPYLSPEQKSAAGGANLAQKGTRRALPADLWRAQLERPRAPSYAKLCV